MNYRVCVWETVGGFIEVEAFSSQEAEDLALGKLEEEGSDCIEDKTHQEFQTCGAEEI